MSRAPNSENLGTDYALFENLFANFAKNELKANRESHERFPFVDYPRSVVEKALELGMFDLLLPEKAGGADQPLPVFCALLTVLSETDAGMASQLFTHGVGQEVLRLTGQEELLTRLSHETPPDRLPLLAFPIFDSPSHQRPLVEARLQDGRYVLSGAVSDLSLGGLAARAIFPARIPDEGSVSYFMVDLKGPELVIGDPLPGLGLKICPAADLELTDVEGRLIGEAGEGVPLFQTLVDKMVLGAAALSLGTMKGSLAEALEYAHLRLQGGRPIAEWSEVKSILSIMAVHVRTAEMALKEACQEAGAENLGWQVNARAVAAHVQEVACDVTTDGIQVLGGYGFMEDYGQEKRFRDATHLQAIFGLNRLKKMDCLTMLSAEQSLGL